MQTKECTVCYQIYVLIHRSEIFLQLFLTGRVVWGHLTFRHDRTVVVAVDAICVDEREAANIKRTRSASKLKIN